MLAAAPGDETDSALLERSRSEYPDPDYTAENSCLENHFAEEKTAPRKIFSVTPVLHQKPLPQTLGTHQENTAFFGTIVLGCVVAPNNAVQRAYQSINAQLIADRDAHHYGAFFGHAFTAAFKLGWVAAHQYSDEIQTQLEIYTDISVFGPDLVDDISDFAGSIKSFTTRAATDATTVSEKTAPELFKDALGTFKNSELTNAGRALTKHPEVVNATKTTLRQALRTDPQINAAASEALKSILRNGVRTTPTVPRYGSVIQYQIPFGYGARWYQTGEWIGFINP